jgi:hypothetical protein
MATRLALKTLVTDNLSSGTGITASEHITVENAIIDSCKPYNTGWFQLGDIASATGVLTSYGVLSATAATGSPANTSKVTIVFNTATPMPDANYYVRMFSRGISSTTQHQDCSAILMFANPTTTQVDIWIRESFGTVQNINVYFEVIPID